MENQEQVQYEKKAKQIIETYKNNMPMYRILSRLDDGFLILEQVNTKVQIRVSEMEIPYNNIAIVNPSFLKNKNSLNKPNYIWRIDNVEKIEHSLNKIPDYNIHISVTSDKNVERKSTFYLSSLISFKTSGFCYSISNLGELEKHIVEYLQTYDTSKKVQVVQNLLYETFSDYTIEILDNNIELFKFKIAEPSDKENAKSTVIRLKTIDNKINITAKRNNVSFNETYSLRNVAFDINNIHKLVVKMHLQLCKELKLTPFRYATSMQYISHQLKHSTELYALKIKPNTYKREVENKEKGNTLSTATFTLGYFTKDSKTKPLFLIPCKLTMKFSMQKAETYIKSEYFLYTPIDEDLISFKLQYVTKDKKIETKEEGYLDMENLFYSVLDYAKKNA